MNTNKLKLINFSNGIKQDEIQYNFNVVQKEINQERRSVSGAGISNGLNFELNNFKLKINKGNLITNDGEEVFIDETIIDIEKPILIERNALFQTVDEDNRIFLQEKPYALNRETSSDNISIEKSGVVAILCENENIKLSIANINNNVITLNDYPDLKEKKVNIFYNITYKRRDVLFIDKNYKLQYRQGITSPSPSIPEVSKDEYSYMLGYLEIDGHYKMDDNKIIANVKFIKDFKSMRNVYTDENNKLYLCGIPFESLKTIHVIEPKDPEEFSLWYDSFSNELKIWRHTDYSEFVDAITFTSSNPNHLQIFDTNVKYKYNKNQLLIYLNGKELKNNIDYVEAPDLTDLQKEDSSLWTKQFKLLVKLQKGDVITYKITRYDGYAEWVGANNKSFINVKEKYIWTPKYISYLVFSCENDLQHFFFDSKMNRNMLFTPKKNCLDIMINQVPLHSDQFDELTINDALIGKDSTFIRKQLVNYYNYKNDFDASKLAEEYENIGIGFKLGAQLEKKNCYIEATVTHRVNSNPIAKRFQRTATFVAEDSVIYNKYIQTKDGSEYQEPIFTCSSPYRYKENQLEVFLNGKRLDSKIDFIELATEENDKGCNLFKFKILTEIKDKDRISYKITSTVYSYDHVEKLLSGVENKISNIHTLVQDFNNSFKEINEKVNKYTSEINNHIELLENIETNIDSKFIHSDTKINKDNLNEELFKGIAKNCINEILTINKEKEQINVTNICSQNDFVVIINISSNKILCRNLDYSIEKSNEEIYLKFLTSSVNVYDKINLTGIRFNN